MLQRAPFQHFTLVPVRATVALELAARDIRARRALAAVADDVLAARDDTVADVELDRAARYEAIAAAIAAEVCPALVHRRGASSTRIDAAPTRHHIPRLSAHFLSRVTTVPLGFRVRQVPRLHLTT